MRVFLQAGLTCWVFSPLAFLSDLYQLVSTKFCEISPEGNLGRGLRDTKPFMGWWSLSLENCGRKGLSILAWVPTVHLWAYFDPSHLGSMWLFWKIKQDLCLWAMLRVSKVTSYFLWQLFGKFWSSSQDSRSVPMVQRSKGHWWQDTQRCCSAHRAWLGLCVYFCRLLG